MIVRKLTIFSLLSFMLAMLVVLLAGWRVGGIDRANYVLMHRMVSLSDSFVEKFYYIHDLFFLGLSEAVTANNLRVEFLFVTVVFLSLVTKYWAINKLSKIHVLPFFLIYIFFLSPGLDFAAIREAMAIGFFFVALAYYNNKALFTVFCLLSILSHVTMVIVVFLGIGRINSLLKKYGIIVYFVIFISIYIASSFILSVFPHGEGYKGNYGTMMAYLLPLSTLFVAKLIYYKFDSLYKKTISFHCFYSTVGCFFNMNWKKNWQVNVYNECVMLFLSRIKYVIYGLIAVSFGFTHLIVTASTRYLEVAWCLLILPAVMLCLKRPVNFIGFAVFVALLAYMNISRLTWAAIGGGSV